MPSAELKLEAYKCGKSILEKGKDYIESELPDFECLYRQELEKLPEEYSLYV